MQTDSCLVNILKVLQARMHGSQKRTPPVHKNSESILNSAPSTGEAVIKLYSLLLQPCRRVSSVRAPPDCASAESLLRGMVEPFGKDSTIPVIALHEERDDLNGQDVPCPSTSSTSACSTALREDVQPGLKCAKPSGAKHSTGKTRRDQDAVQEDLLKHLGTKISENKALADSVAQSQGRWNPLTSARFKSEVMQMVAEYKVKYQGKD